DGGGSATLRDVRVDASATRSRSRSGLLWVRPEQLPEACSRLARERFVVAIAGMGTTARCALRRALDDAIQGALAARGALPASVDPEAELGRIIRDQVFRAQALGASGLALVIPSLEPIVGADATLDPDDGAALVSWVEAARDGGVVLVLDEGSRAVRVIAPV